MKARNEISKSILAALALIMIILDTKTAIEGVSSGIDICLKSIIPALFPFCVLSKIITGIAVGQTIPGLRSLGKICGIPPGAESIFILSFVGGYPFGAQCVSYAYQNKIISQSDASRMTAFCNNAGFAFIFGMLKTMFENKIVPCALLAVQILSSILVGAILPNKSKNNCSLQNIHTTSFSSVVGESVKTMGIICGWVVLFRLVINYLGRWVFPHINESSIIILTGILELSNGCISLYNVSLPGLRYIVASAMLSAGGLCVAMQTSSVTRQIGKTLYIPGKILQTCLSTLIAYCIQPMLFEYEQQYCAPLLLPAICIIVLSIIVSVMHRKKG